MAMSMVGQQSTVMTQHFQTKTHRSQSHNVEIMTPDGDLGDVEADFQRMVNEMAQDNSRRAITQPTSSSVSFSSSSQKKIMTSTSGQSGGIVRAVPARVISQPVGATSYQSVGATSYQPLGGTSYTEVVSEKTTGVKDRIKRLEKQYSQDEIGYVPESSVPSFKSTSVKNLSEQFEKPRETNDPMAPPSPFAGQCIQGGSTSLRDVSHYQPPSMEQPTPSPVPYHNVNEYGSFGVSRSTSNPGELNSTNQQSSQYSATYVQSKNQKEESQVAVDELEKSLHDISICTNELSRSLSETNSNQIQNPVQYSAEVRCEVKSRVNAPEIQTRKIYSDTEMRQSRFDAFSSSSKKTESTSSALSSNQNGEVLVSGQSHFTASAPTPLARCVAKPPPAEGGDKDPPKFSLLRSVSAGSVKAFGENMRIMNRSTSDKDLPKFSVKKVHSGTRVWSPGTAPLEQTGPSRIDNPDLPSFKDIPQVWTPARGGSASPSSNKREYRKITFDGPTVPKRAHQQEGGNVPRPEESFAWQGKVVEINKSESLNLPRAPNATVTLLQKKREGLIQDHKAEYINADESSYFKPGDKLYTIKKEYESEDEDLGNRKFAVLGPRKIQGVGPTTREGMPTSLKTGVKSEHHGEWYRRMFDSLHKVKDESNTKSSSSKVRYGGYMSEPGYDSDAGVTRYAKYDRSKNEFEFENSEPTVARKTKRYVHQPGRIENYVPGFSSLSERELRENPEADVKLEITTPRPSQQTFQGVRRLGGGYKESGYDSDSTLVFKKREDSRRKVQNPRETSDIYKEIQRGGDIPLEGLQRPAPRPNEPVIGVESYPYYSLGYDGSMNEAPPHNKYETSEVNIHYRTPIRVERKDFVSDEELARRQEEHMTKVYEQERRKKYLSELEDIERRRHTDNFTPLQKSPIPLNRYDDEVYGGLRGFKTSESRQLAKTLFGFQAQNKRELTFNKGDIITIRRHIDKNWMEGEFKGNIGIFPSNYVEVLPFDNIKTMARRPTEGQARVRFNFQAQTNMEMSLNKGEIIALTRRVDDNWFEGRMSNRKGIFPVSYVDVLQEPLCRDTPPIPDTLSRPALPPPHLLFNGTSSVNSPYSTLGHHGNQSDSKASFSQLTVNTQQEPIAYRALYNYKPQNDDELELLEGDVVMVMEKCDDGWFVGTSQRTNSFGTFPGNYVEKM